MIQKKKIAHSATLETLCTLHLRFTEQLLKDLSQPHYRDRDGREVIPSGLYSVVSRFLASNGIKADSNAGTPETNPLKALKARFEKAQPGDDLETTEDTSGLIEGDDDDDFLADHEGLPEA